MPQLKRLAAGATDATPERIFARALHDAAQREVRKAAATACAAPARTMASRLGRGDQDLLSDLRLEDVAEPLTRLGMMPLEESIQHAVLAARQAAATSLFVVDNAAYVAKCIRNALDAENVDASERDAILDRLLFHQTREIHVLLSILHDVQHCQPNRPARVFIGPLCGFLAPFLTASGLTTTGDGLLRMVQLACKRLQSACTDTQVTFIQERPLLKP